MYISCISSNPHIFEAMVDGLGVAATNASLTVLTHAILDNPKVSPQLVGRVLLHLMDLQKTPPKVSSL